MTSAKKARILLLILLVLMAATAFFLWIFSTNEKTPESVSTVEFEPPVSQTTANSGAEQVISNDANGESFKTCRAILFKIQNKTSELTRNPVSIPETLQREYDLKQIFIAFRALGVIPENYEHIKSRQEDPRYEALAFAQSLEHSEAFYFGPDNRRVVDRGRFFRNFLTASHDQRIELAHSTKLLASDVAYMIGSVFSEDEIITVLDYLDDPNQLISSQSHQGGERYLIDSAAAAGLYKVFNYLLQRGAIIVNDAATTNILEKTIFKASLRSDSLSALLKIEGYRKIIEALAEYNLPVRIQNVPFDDRVAIGGALAPFLSRPPNDEDIAAFRLFGIDLGRRITKDYFKGYAQPDVLASVSKYLDTIIFADIAGGKTRSIECQQYATNVIRTIRHFSTEKYIAQVIHQNNGEVDRIVEALERTEPALVDAYRATSSKPTPSHVISINFDDPAWEIQRLLENNQSDKAKQKIIKENPDEETRDKIFWQVIASNPDNLAFLVEQGIEPQNLDFRKLASLSPETYKALTDWGFQPDTFDHRGKALVYYAAIKCNAELIDYLRQHQYPYHSNKKGEDPLSAALRYTECIKWNGRTYPGNYSRAGVVGALLKFNPPIKTHHYQRMAELRLLEIEDYKQIIAAYPQLAIDDAVQPSGYYVEPVVIWDGMRYRRNE